MVYKKRETADIDPHQLRFDERKKLKQSTVRNKRQAKVYL